ncbi:hypothetical protein ES702_03934 [subsurface metagenome]
MKEKEYRITRPDLYKSGSPGHNDVKARQGHYYLADSIDEALEIASDTFQDHCFDIQAVEKGQFTKPCRRMRIDRPFTFEKKKSTAITE